MFSPSGADVPVHCGAETQLSFPEFFRYDTSGTLLTSNEIALNNLHRDKALKVELTAEQNPCRMFLHEIREAYAITSIALLNGLMPD